MLVMAAYNAGAESPARFGFPVGQAGLAVQLHPSRVGQDKFVDRVPDQFHVLADGLSHAKCTTICHVHCIFQ